VDDLTKLKLELSQGWRLLFRHKYKRPAYVPFPKSVFTDIRFIKLSVRAKAAVPIMLLIASEDQDRVLPNAEIVFRRLRELGISQRKDSFLSLIHELIQGGLLQNVAPEYRVQRTENKEDKKERASSAREATPNGFASPTACDLNSDRGVGDEVRDGESPPLGQPHKPEPAPELREITNGSGANRVTADYAAALSSFGPIKSRFDRGRR
jgi:hypothetical protein